MKRPILVMVIGYIIGIIVGLYLKTSIVPFYIIIVTIYLIHNFFKTNNKRKLKLISIKRYFRYIKIYLNFQVITLIIISSLISNTIIIIQNKKYNKTYENLSREESIMLNGIIISNKQEKQYYNKYKIQVNYNNKKIKFFITTNKKIELEYGDEIVFLGTYIKPETQRNYKGFDYLNYLKQLKIYGTIKSNKITKIDKDKSNKIFKISNQILTMIISNTKKCLDEETSSILLGVILGYKEGIDEETQDNFTNASMSHILAVSGMHVTYVILGVRLILKNILGKKTSNIICIFVLIFYMFITNFTPSIVRAGIMGIIMLFSKIIHRKNDIYTSISISTLLILIYNPFIIQNIGFQLTYCGVIGIIAFNKNILNFLKNIKIKNKFYKYKIRPKIQKKVDNIKEIISVSVSVQIAILPVLIYNFNTINPYFLISNLILSIFIGPIVIISFLFIITVLINIKIAKAFSTILTLGIKILALTSKLGELPFAKIYIATPNLFIIILYYSCLIILFSLYKIYSSKNPNKTHIRIRNLIALGRINTRKYKVKKYFITAILILLLLTILPKKLEMHFIDVGQGDSTLIITPQKKTILIDGGGTNSDFDIGKNTLIPYVLDRGFTSIDIIIISHFDSDHVKGIISLMQELKVKKVYISKQIEKSENYEQFLKICKDKNIQIYEISAGDRIQIEKNLYFDILWPTRQYITKNVLNNNAIVCNLHYKNFTMLFTGDIEEIAEQEILKIYSKNKNLLKADILKVAHHGSKSSSTKEFLQYVNPKIAIIGVGKDNNFGHPNDGVLDRLYSLNCKIFRTDLNGEISIKVDRKSKFKIITKLSN